MAIFAIILRKPSPDVTKKVQDKIGKHYTDKYDLNSNVTIISTKDTSEDIALKTGIVGDNRIDDVSGAVIKLQNTYSGYTLETFWDWLEQHESDF